MGTHFKIITFVNRLRNWRMLVRLSAVFIVMFLALSSCWAQGNEVYVNWETKVYASDTEDASHCVELTAGVRAGWYFYSQHQSDSFGPQPTTFSFLHSDQVSAVGNMRESEVLGKYNPSVEAFEVIFVGTPVFKQCFQVDSNVPEVVQVTVHYQTCDDLKCVGRADLIEVELNPAQPQ